MSLVPIPHPPVRNTRRILLTLLSILVSVFLVSGIVVAATTIGSSLSTDGNLTVLGNTGIGTSTPSARCLQTGGEVTVNTGTAPARCHLNGLSTVSTTMTKVD